MSKGLIKQYTDLQSNLDQGQNVIGELSEFDFENPNQILDNILPSI